MWKAKQIAKKDERPIDNPGKKLRDCTHILTLVHTLLLILTRLGSEQNKIAAIL